MLIISYAGETKKNKTKQNKTKWKKRPKITFKEKKHVKNLKSKQNRKN